MGRKNLKNIAESQFNFNAKPISIRKFFKDLESEEGLPPIFSENNNQQSVVSPIKEEEPTLSPTFKQVAADICLTKHFEPFDEPIDLDISTLFNQVDQADPLINQIRINDIEIQQSINSKADFKFNISEELNHERRLSKLVSHIQKVAPRFSKHVLKIEKDLSTINVESIHINDNRGLTELQTLFSQKAFKPIQVYNCLMIKTLQERELHQLPLQEKVRDFLKFKETNPEFDLTIEELYRKTDINFFNFKQGRSSRSRDIRFIATVLLSDFNPEKKLEKLKLYFQRFIKPGQPKFYDDFESHLNSNDLDEFWTFKK